jgi:glycosyltransferase involved in cell wall biosynthesis
MVITENTQKNNKPLVSIIIGTKNRSKLLPRAINSILQQTYINWECLIIDGASTDDTRDVVNRFSDERIKYINLNPDPGRIQTLNIGLQRSKGNYITFLDDDDEYYPDKVKKQVELFTMADNAVGLIYCWTNFFDEKSDKTLFYCKNSIEGNVFKYTLEKMSLCSFPTLMFKREALDKIGGFQDRVGFPSDWQTVCRLAQYYHVKYAPEVLVKVNKNHIYEQMSKPENKTLDYYIRVSNWQIDFLNEFKEGYKKYPKKSLVHIYPLISSLPITGRFHLMLKYYFKAILIQPISLQPHKKLFSGIINRLKY